MFLVEGAEPPDEAASGAAETPQGSTYTYGRAVTFGLDGTGPRYDLGGWDQSEGIFSWATTAPAMLGFRVPPARGPLSLKVRAAVVSSGARLQVQPVELRVNGEKLTEWTIREPLQWFTAEVPPEIANAAGSLRVELATPSRMSEAAARLPKELRPRGVQLHDVLITDGS
jgi:hypothetical protein